MKCTILTHLLALAVLAGPMLQPLGAQEAVLLTDGIKVLNENANTHLPNAIRFATGREIRQSEFPAWARHALLLPAAISFKAYSVENDELGYVHTRYAQYVQSFPVEGAQLITHGRGQFIVSVNGDYYKQVAESYSASLTEPEALKLALNKVHARRYKWENKKEEHLMQQSLGNPAFSYYPKGELVVVHKTQADYSAGNMRLAYKFNVYADQPLSRTNVFVDANTGEIVAEQNLLDEADVSGTANTRYSGNQPMVSDNYSTGQYRLQETGRGKGIQTFNLNNSTAYANTDFTSTSSAWNLTGPDQVATDAHWGAEKTYDYYKQVHSRNSIDGNGFALLSYVHYSNKFQNAFWDGQRMNYGDGDSTQGTTPFTALDLCGHEITHGLTANTARLTGSGSGEPGALNEGFSDIFGKTIEWYSRPAKCNWVMGTDFSTSATYYRSLANPKLYGQPDTYKGTNWDAAGQEVHKNNGPCIHWYYLLCVGGSGTNDLGNAWTVSGITMAEARMIAFRALTVYFTSSTMYTDARMYSIQAATDLYGSCSAEVKAVTDAWYAVGVGAKYTAAAVAAAFSADQTSSCSLPAVVHFTNSTANGSAFVWNFGDGTGSTTVNPQHTYTASGTYNVELIATGCAGTGKDSVLKSAYIVINSPAAPAGTNGSVCGTGAVSLSAAGSGTLVWMDSLGNKVNTGSTYTTPVLTHSVTYYVSSSTPGTVATGAPATNTSAGGGGYLNASHYLLFNAGAAFTLQTVDVYAQAATGSAPAITLQDSAGTVLLTASPALTVMGKNTVTLNFHVNPGRQYRLVASGSNINLYRNNAGAVYPYAVGSVASITGTDISASSPAYYYFFYNWVTQTDGCESASVPVSAVVNPIPQVVFNYSGGPVCRNAPPVTLTASPSGGTFSGPGVSGNKFDPTGLGVATYQLNYTYTSAAGCSNTDTTQLTISACVTGIQETTGGSNCVLFPNPAGLVTHIRSEEAMNRIEVYDVIGKSIMVRELKNQTTADLDMVDWPAGVYFVKIVTASNQKTLRLLKN